MVGKGKKRGVSMESTRGTKEKSPVGQSLLKQKTIFINITSYYVTRLGNKYNEIQEKKINLNNQKMTNHPPYTVLIFRDS